MADNNLFYAVGGVVFGGVLFFKGFKWYMLKKTIEDTPTSKIRSLAMGFVEVFGKVVPDKVLISPFSGAKCVYFRYWIDEWKKTGKNSSGWVTVKQGSQEIPFFIKDDTGIVLVDSKGADIDIPTDFTRESGMGNDPSGLMKKFLKSQGVGFEGFFGINKRMRYREAFLAPDDTVYVMGFAGDNPFVGEGAGKTNDADIMIQNGKGFFYISDQPEKKLLSKLRLKAYGSIAGGGALILFCLFIIFSELNIL